MNIAEKTDETSRNNVNLYKEPTAQELYVKSHRRHHHIVTVLRLIVLVSFLGLWEAAGRLGWIDTFFFSSPGMVISYFMEMIKDGSFFTHTGITLLETLISFLLITIISVIAATLLWYSKTLSGGVKQPSQVGSCAPFHRLAGYRDHHHHCGRNICGSLWFHHQPVYWIQTCG